MKIPKQVSSARFIRHLERNWGYTFSRQSGSHVILTTGTPIHHSLPIPVRKSIGEGLFHALLKQVCAAKQVAVEDLLKDL